MMVKQVLRVIDGPDKPHLQFALFYADRNLHVHFSTANDILDASLAELEELEDGFSFKLAGAIETGPLKGSSFHGVYSVASRTGVLSVEDRAA